MIQSLDFYNFPEDLEVKLSPDGKQISLVLSKISNDVKTELQKRFSKTYVALTQDKKSARIKIIKGGNPENRLKYLIDLLTLSGLYNPDGILPFSRRYLHFLDKRINRETRKSDLEKMEEIQLGKLEQYEPVNLPTAEKLTKLPVKVEKHIGSILISIFSNDQVKITSEAVTAVHVNIPKEMVIGVKEVDSENLQFTFEDHLPFTAAEIKATIERALNVITGSYLYRYRFVNCLPLSDEVLNSFNNSHIYNISVYNKQNGIYDVVVVSRGNEEEDIKNSILRLSEIVKMQKCKKCGKLYGAKQESDCILTSHKGKRIPFENGDMSRTLYDNKVGDFVTYYNYECCKVQPSFSGCDKKSLGKHEAEETPFFISSIVQLTGQN